MYRPYMPDDMRHHEFFAIPSNRPTGLYGLTLPDFFGYCFLPRANLYRYFLGTYASMAVFK